MKWLLIFNLISPTTTTCWEHVIMKKSPWCCRVCAARQTSRREHVECSVMTLRMHSLKIPPHYRDEKRISCGARIIISFVEWIHLNNPVVIHDALSRKLAERWLVNNGHVGSILWGETLCKAARRPRRTDLRWCHVTLLCHSSTILHLRDVRAGI